MARRAEPILLTATACRSCTSGRGGIWCPHPVAVGNRYAQQVKKNNAERAMPEAVALCASQS